MLAPARRPSARLEGQRLELADLVREELALARRGAPAPSRAPRAARRRARQPRCAPRPRARASPLPRERVEQLALAVALAAAAGDRAGRGCPRACSPSSRSCAAVAGRPFTNAARAPAGIDGAAQQARRRPRRGPARRARRAPRAARRRRNPRSPPRAAAPARTTPASARPPSASLQRVEQDRLARAGLAGERGEARRRARGRAARR